jgi:hypothetical protein
MWSVSCESISHFYCVYFACGLPRLLNSARPPPGSQFRWRHLLPFAIALIAGGSFQVQLRSRARPEDPFLTSRVVVPTTAGRTPTHPSTVELVDIPDVRALPQSE